MKKSELTEIIQSSRAIPERHRPECLAFINNHSQDWPVRYRSILYIRLATDYKAVTTYHIITAWLKCGFTLNQIAQSAMRYSVQYIMSKKFSSPIHTDADQMDDIMQELLFRVHRKGAAYWSTKKYHYKNWLHLIIDVLELNSIMRERLKKKVYMVPLESATLTRTISGEWCSTHTQHDGATWDSNATHPTE